MKTKSMKVKIKKLNENAIIPVYAHATDAGLDLTAVSKTVEKNGVVTYGTGIAVEIPEGYVGLVFPRSSNSKKHLLLTNSVGVIDSGYRGEIMLKYTPTLHTIRFVRLIDRLKDFFVDVINSATTFYVDAIHAEEYNIGDRVGQLIILPYPSIEFEETDELSTTERGTGGYGSTGK